MKEKRYFCDIFFGIDEKIPHRLDRLITFVFIGVLIIGSIFCYSYISKKFENELNSYSESTYVYLDEIANKVIEEGVGINLLALPDDVAKYEITGENGKIIFKYSLDNNKEMSYAMPAEITIELSDNFTILSKKHNYSSEIEYVKDIKFFMIFVSVLNVVIALMCVVLIYMLIGTTAACISLAHKKKDFFKQQIEKNN